MLRRGFEPRSLPREGNMIGRTTLPERVAPRRYLAVIGPSIAATPRKNGPAGINLSEIVATTIQENRMMACGSLPQKPTRPLIHYQLTDIFKNLNIVPSTMSLKPEPHTAVLVQERIQETLHSGKLSKPEQQAMKEFDRDLEQYLDK